MLELKLSFFGDFHPVVVPSIMKMNDFRGDLTDILAEAKPLVCSCRFGLDGLVVGWVEEAELLRGIRAEDVAQRDPLRQDEGSSASGYSLDEALLLCQSSSHLQRRTGVRTTVLMWTHC